jgi:Flp pilus assembly protein TadG
LSERGQTLPLITLFMFVLLGICALAIDAGLWYQQKRQLQNGADAAALAGALSLPQGWTQASSSAGTEFSQNLIGPNSGTATYQQATMYRSGDSVLVTATRQSPTFFAKAFGKSAVTLTVTAQATIANSGGGALPWGVMPVGYQPGQSYDIYTKNGPNNGAVRLAAWDGSSCSTSGGSALYSNELGGSETLCPVVVGDTEKTDAGQNAGPTTQGVSDRCPGGLKPVSQVVTFNAAGTPTIVDASSCQLVLLPVVVNDADGSSNWPANGSTPLRVVGFSWWVIGSVTQNGKVVQATYVGDAPTTPGSGSSLPSAYHAQLTR